MILSDENKLLETNFDNASHKYSNDKAVVKLNNLNHNEYKFICTNCRNVIPPEMQNENTG